MSLYNNYFFRDHTVFKDNIFNPSRRTVFDYLSATEEEYSRTQSGRWNTPFIRLIMRQSMRDIFMYDGKMAVAHDAYKNAQSTSGHLAWWKLINPLKWVHYLLDSLINMVGLMLNLVLLALNLGLKKICFGSNKIDVLCAPFFMVTNGILTLLKQHCRFVFAPANTLLRPMRALFTQNPYKFFRYVLSMILLTGFVASCLFLSPLPFVLPVVLSSMAAKVSLVVGCFWLSFPWMSEIERMISVAVRSLNHQHPLDFGSLESVKINDAHFTAKCVHHFKGPIYTNRDHQDMTVLEQVDHVFFGGNGSPSQ